MAFSQQVRMPFVFIVRKIQLKTCQSRRPVNVFFIQFLRILRRFSKPCSHLLKVTLYTHLVALDFFQPTRSIKMIISGINTLFPTCRDRHFVHNIIPNCVHNLHCVMVASRREDSVCERFSHFKGRCSKNRGVLRFIIKLLPEKANICIKSSH